MVEVWLFKNLSNWNMLKAEKFGVSSIYSFWVNKTFMSSGQKRPPAGLLGLFIIIYYFYYYYCLFSVDQNIEYSITVLIQNQKQIL